MALERSLLLLAVLAAPAWSAKARPAPSTPAPFSPSSVRWVAVGQSLVDTRAPGAPLLLKALEYKPEPKTVLGLYDQDSKQVVNSFMHGDYGVLGHKDAIPQGWQGGPLGGYVFALTPSGETFHAGSGHFKNGITPSVERSLLRYFGVVPAKETWLGWIGRKALNLWDRFERRFLV